MAIIPHAIDPRSGLAIPQTRVGVPGPRARGIGTITYRCHTCGESIVRPWEVLFVDTDPASEWAGYIVPAHPSPSMSTHHDWHMAATQED